MKEPVNRMATRHDRKARTRGLRVLPCVAAAALVLSAVASATAGAPPVCGDVEANSALTASDALRILRLGVGQDVEILCPPKATPLRTGQTTCYDAGGTESPCPGTRQDAALAFGAARSFINNGNGTILDNATGLTWEKLSNDGSIHDVDNEYTWAEAFSVKIAALNAASFGGSNTWRLPNRFELETLVSLGAADPATHEIFNSGCGASCTVTTCSCTASDYYWTSTTAQVGQTSAWTVLFETGHEEWDAKTSTNRVRAVR